MDKDKLKHFDTLAQTELYLREHGYDQSYRFEEGKLSLIEGELSYHSDEITIVEECRFEGMSNPGDSSILIVIETSDGKKGSLVSSYGSSYSGQLLKFVEQHKDA